MPHAALSAAIARTRPAESDGELLARFVRERDDESFAQLVRHLGPMVLGVCRRVAGDPHLADDAFQAAFLVLARRAADVRPREAVRGWLYGVAVRTAREARTVSARRRARETPVPVLPDSAAESPDPPDADALRMLDEEVAALPDHLRTAVVLCELDGLPRRVAAERLGVAEGTLSSRLAKARKVLAGRLKGRGVAVSAAGLGALLAASPVSARLVDRTSGLLTADPIPAAIAGLTKGAFRAMYLQKLAACCLAAALVAACFASPSPDPVPKPRAVMSFAQAAGPREGVLVVMSFQKGPPIERFAPDGKELGRPPVGAAAYSVNPGEVPVCPLWNGRVSPDGKRLVAMRLGPILQNHQQRWTPHHMWVFDLTGKDTPPELLAGDVCYPSAAWSPDGSKLYVTHIDPAKTDEPTPPGKLESMVGWVYDVATKKRTPLATPPGHAILDVSPDGKTLLTMEVEPLATEDPVRTFLIPLDTLKCPAPLTKGTLAARRFSPDGKSVLGHRMQKGTGPQLAAVSVADGKEKPIPLADGVQIVMDSCWSPDGKRVAYFWQQEVPPPPGVPLPAENPPKFYDHRVTVSDLDGKNAKTILRRDHDQQVMNIDWR